MATEKAEFTLYKVWDLPVRLFHWINVLSVVALFFFGFLMLYKKELGIVSMEAKISLKSVHVIIGYVFVTNLAIRLIWAFAGNRYARWSAFLPRPSKIRHYLASLRGPRPEVWAGHNPLGRLAVSTLYLFLLIMALTGLVRAGTDIYFPPFGAFAQDYVAADPTTASQIKPYDESLVDEQKYAQLKAFKSPFGDVHVFTAYALLALIVLHITAVIITERREGGALISAMFTGKKYLRGRPEDADG